MRYLGSIDVMRCIWGFDDLESGIRQIRATVSTADAPPVIDELELAFPTDPTQRLGDIDLDRLHVRLKHAGQYWLHVCAQDYMNHSACSEPWGVLIDLTPPACETPLDMLPRYTARKAGVQARWSCTDPESGVLNTQWMPYVEEPGGMTRPLLVKPIVHKGASSSGSVATPMLQGGRYFHCISAINGAGLVGQSANCSAGTTYDGTPPTALTMRDFNGSGFVNTNTSVCTTWTGFADEDSGIYHFEWELLLEDGDDDVLMATAELEPSLVAGSTECFDGLAAPLEHGRLYYSQMRVTNRAELRTTIRSRGFYIDHTSPLTGRTRLKTVLPAGFDRQPDFPASLTGLVVRLNIGSGFVDPESGIAEYLVRILANGTVVSSGTVSGRSDRYETLALPEVANGTIIEADIVARNRAGLYSHAVWAAPLLFSLSELQFDDPWVADDRGLPFELPFTTDVALAVGFLAASDPMQPDVIFSYDWAIADAPCDDEEGPLSVRWRRPPTLQQQWYRGNAIDPASRAAYATMQGLAAAETAGNRLDWGRGFYARAYGAPLVTGESYCVMVTACAHATEAVPTRCKNATSSLIRVEETPPLAQVTLLPTAPSRAILGFPLTVQISCSDDDSGLSDTAAAFVSLGTTYGATDLLHRMLVLFNSSVSEGSGDTNSSEQLLLVSNSSGMQGEVKIALDQLTAVPGEGRWLFATLTCTNGADMVTEAFSSAVVDVSELPALHT
jgi:hypothetical protein